jgi:monothiol glutaredoxin
MTSLNPLFRTALRLTTRPSPPSLLRPLLTPTTRRLLSAETKSAITAAVASAPVVLFMKGTPETPQCGFSRASIQILSLQGVDPGKFTAFNVLEDDALRSGTLPFLSPTSMDLSVSLPCSMRGGG